MMKSNFLNLPSSASGDARRHVPFRSIINKHISILFVLSFVFSIMFSYVHPVAALADPVFQPVYDTQFYQLPQFVDPLNSTQQDIFYFILGSQVVEYAGLSDYQIENPYSDPSSVGEWFKKIGIDLYNDVLESFAIAGAPVIVGAKWVKDLYANIAGAANFAGAFNNSSFNDFLSDVQTDGLSLQLYPSMFGALNQFYANNNSLYEWQFNTSGIPFDVEVPTREMSGSALTTYNSYLNSMYPARAYCNISGYGLYNVVIAGTAFDNVYGFFNTTRNRFFLVKADGSELPTSNYGIGCEYLAYDPSYGRVTYQANNAVTYNNVSYSLTGYDSYYDLAYHFKNTENRNLFWYGSKTGGVYLNFVNAFYYGSSWDERTLIVQTTDLNFSENTKPDTLAPVIDTLLDIKGLINDILEQNELKQPALDNLTDLNGDPLPATQLQPVSVAVELPDSGITINSGLFTPLTKNGGYINYLWYMTKPLVQYTSDLVQTLVFPDDTGEGFDATGPGVIVFGVISLGLIGGLVVKCLL